MNDAVLLKNVLTFAGIEGYTQQIRPLEVGLKNVRALRDASTCTPVAYALYFGSTEALALVRPRDVIDGIGRGFLADNSTEVFRVSDAVCPHDQVPSPEMVCSALNLMKSTRAGEFNGEDESWLRDILVQKACSGVWSHLLPMLIEHHPDVFDLDLLVAETQATFHALPGLVAHLLPTMDIPPMSIQAGATNPLPSRHPLYHLVQGVEAGNVERGDVDATLLMVLREMQSRDLMGDVWSGTSTGGKPIVFSSVEHGWTSSLVFLVGAGLDLDQSVSDRTLDEWAKDARNPRSADILRAARARRSALEALDSMASAQAP